MSRRLFTYLASLISLLIGVSSVLAETVVTQQNAVIIGDEIWTIEGSPYILTRDVEVRPQGSLTIQPGVEVQFAETDATASGEDPNGVELIIKGRFVAIGTQESPILFNGQDLLLPQDHATGVRFEAGSQNSILEHVNIRGLAYGIDIREDIALTLESIQVEVGHVALKKTVNQSDLQLVDVHLIGNQASIQLTQGLDSTHLFLFEGGSLDGDFLVDQTLEYGSRLNLTEVFLDGSLKIDGLLQAGARVEIESSLINQGTLWISGNLNTGSAILINQSAIEAPLNKNAFYVGGIISADAEIMVQDSSLDGHVKVGPAVEVNGEFEGQYVYIDTPSTWNQASAACQSMGARLADVRSASEAEILYQISTQSSSGYTWIGGSLVDDACGPGQSYFDVADVQACTDLQNAGYPVQTVIRGQECPCNQICGISSRINPNCNTNNNFDCPSQNDITHQAQMPLCDGVYDTAAPCHGDDLNWTWESGSAFDHTFALWGEGDTDRLSCLQGENLLSTALHIAVDTVDSSGQNSGRFGLWRAHSSSNMYGYICEGQLAVVADNESSRGSLSITSSAIMGSISARLGALSIEQSQVEGTANFALSRGGMVKDSLWTGSFNLTSLDAVLIQDVEFKAHVLYGGGVAVEAESSTFLRNMIDQGTYGLSVRGPTTIESNVITRSELIGLQLFPEGSSGTQNSSVVNNTLVENTIGLRIEGTINAPNTLIGNNLVYRGTGIGMMKIGLPSVTLSHNNVFGFAQSYNSDFLAFVDGDSLSAEPSLIADFPTDPAILRLDSGSRMIDAGNCSIAPTFDIDGTPHNFDGDFDLVPGCDIGAYEFGPERVFIRVDGIDADQNSFSTGREVSLSLYGIRDGNIFEVNPVVWSISSDVGLFDEATRRFRPVPTPDFYPQAISASFGSMSSVLDVNLSCGCIAPDLADGSPGGCNGVPQCYFEDWDCPVRQNYCQVAEVGSFDNPLILDAEETTRVRAGARDIFGFVFRVDGPFTYDVINGGGTIDDLGRFTAGREAGDFENTIQISWNGVSGTSDVRVVPGPASSIAITRDQQTVGTTLTLDYHASVRDQFNNIIEDADVEWTLINAQDASINPQTGRVSAGCIPGTYSNAVVATFGGISSTSDLIVQEGGAVLERIDIIPPSIEIAATTNTQFSATVTDACNYTRTAPNALFTTRNNTGEIDPQTGVYQASCNLGLYNEAVSVSSNGLTSSAQVNILDAPLDGIRVQPENAQVRTNQDAVFEAIGEDRCGRITPINPTWTSPIVNATTEAIGVGSEQRLRLGCSRLDLYPTGIRATVGSFTATASVEILAGAVALLNPTLDFVDQLPAGNEIQLNATTEDACGNSRSDALTWSSSIGQIDETGLYQAGCVRGEYENAVFVRAGDLEAAIDIDVIDGVLSRIEIDPSPITLKAAESRELRATLYDGCDNVIEGEVEWSIAEGGTIDDNVLTANETAGTYTSSILAELGSFQDQADLIITPGLAQTIEVTPNPIRVEAGSRQPLSVIATDAYGNQFPTEVLWSANPNSGIIGNDNVFVAGTQVGIFGAAVQASVDQAILSVDVEIVPAEVARLNVQPNPIIVEAGGQLQLTASPVDQFGNPVNAPIIWSVEGEGGVVNGQGLFSASEVAGTYQGSLIARSGNVSSVIDIQITPSSASTLQILPAQIILTPQAQVQLEAKVFDSFGNEIAGNAVYTIEADGASVTASGLLRAGILAGTYTNTLLVRSEGLETFATVEVIPGNAVQVQVNPNRVSVAPLQGIQIETQFRDAFDNLVDVTALWSDFGRGGSVSEDGFFTANEDAGLYTQALVVRGGGLEQFIDVEVVAGSPTEMRIDPELIVTSAGTEVQLGIQFFDQYGNETQVDDVEFNWSTVSGTLFQVSADGLLNVGCSVAPGLYRRQIIATASNVINPATQSPFVAYTDLEVRPGDTTFVEINPSRVEIQVTSSALLTAQGKDACGYDTFEVAQWRILQGQGTVNPEGRFTAGTLAETVIVEASIREVNATAEVIVDPGSPVRLSILPAEVTMTVDQRFTFEVEAEDSYGNQWTPEDVVWAVEDENGSYTQDSEPNVIGPVGTITEQGELRSGEAKGRFLRAIKASFDNRNAYADVYLVPDVPDSIEVLPNMAVVFPNQRLAFETNVRDRFGNLIENANPIFSCQPEVGVCEEQGLLTATANVDEYPNSVTAQIDQVITRIDVSVINSEPERIEIVPGSLQTTVNSLNLLEVRVFDTTGTLIENASVNWSVLSEDLGTIMPTPDGNARLQTSLRPGQYFGGVIANIDAIQGTADILIPEDFDEDGIADTLEIEHGLDPRVPEDANEDWDNDGLSNQVEINRSVPIDDGDSDDDGIADGDEAGWDLDTDGDGLINALDADSDGDGLLDGTEVGLTQPNQDTEDRSSDTFIPDLDPSTTTDPLNPDSDGDGLLDGTEDQNRNGRLDKSETSPLETSNAVHCDPSAEETGCSEDEICDISICRPKVDDTPPPADDGCQSNSQASHFMLLFALLSLLSLSSRRRFS
jgi:hypothetical protein